MSDETNQTDSPAADEQVSPDELAELLAGAGSDEPEPPADEPADEPAAEEEPLEELSTEPIGTAAPGAASEGRELLGQDAISALLADALDAAETYTDTTGQATGSLAAAAGAGFGAAHKEHDRVGEHDLLADVMLQVSAEIGRTEMTIEDILKMHPGSLVELDKLAGEPVELFVNDKCIARGEVVVVDDSFGIRITALGATA